MPAPTEESSFANFLKESRERKKNEALAQEILGSRARKAQTAGAGSVGKNRPNSQKPTLLSRVSGVQKPRSASAKPAGSIDGKWQHDLHKFNNPNGPPSQRLHRTASASQIDRNTRTYNKFASAVTNNARLNSAPSNPGFSIRGVANGGLYTVIASNFAPGTTAADIEAVMAPIGGETQACRVLASAPTVMVELVFTSKEGAENVVATFNNQKADGRLLYVYMKNGSNNAPLQSRPFRDAAQSFDDMDVDMSDNARPTSYQSDRRGFNNGSRRDPPRGPRRHF